MSFWASLSGTGWSILTHLVKVINLEDPASQALVCPAPPTPLSISTYRACLPSINVSTETQIEGFELTIFANTAPPKNTICLLRGGSSILTLNFCENEISLLLIDTSCGTHIQPLRISLQYPCQPQLL